MTEATADGRFGMSTFQRSIHLIIAAAVTIPIFAMLMEGGNRPSGAFFVFAALPSVVGLLHHASNGRRFEKNKAELEMRGGKPRTSGIERFEPNTYTAVTSCLTLYAVFLVGALLSNSVTNRPITATPAAENALRAMDGLHALMLAGFGAYVSVLWYMLGRINANALSSRFIINSALKVAAAMVMGYVAGYIGMFKSLAEWQQGAFFLIGMFQAFAMNYLRRKAIDAFGVKQAAAEDLPLSLIEGMDDSAADLLTENGITTVQHLATTDPIELAFRTLCPLDRALDWVDQAILILEFGPARIAALRDAQIRTVTGFVLVYRTAAGDKGGPLKDAAVETLKALAQKIGVAEQGLRLKGEILEQSQVVDVIEALWNKPAAREQTFSGKESVGEVKLPPVSLVRPTDEASRPAP